MKKDTDMKQEFSVQGPTKKSQSAELAQTAPSSDTVSTSEQRFAKPMVSIL
jgi:hypothetical protein